jgi:hypothetical protein
VAAGEPPALDALGGDVISLRGAPAPYDVEPVQTVYVVRRGGDELLQPAGEAIFRRGFAGAQPDGPATAVLVSLADEQAALLGGSAIALHGFALALPDARPNVLACWTEPPPLAALAGDVISLRATIEADSPPHVTQPTVVQQLMPDLAILECRIHYGASRIDPAPSFVPAPSVASGDETAVVLALGEGRAITNVRASLAPSRSCNC